MSASGQCPRCGRWAIEHLKTHSHCWECSYFPENNEGLRQWREIEFRKPKIARQRSADHQGGGRCQIIDFERLRSRTLV